MVDIMMCEASACPKAAQCRRSKASGTRADPFYQSYWIRAGSSPVGDDCDYFWPVALHTTEATHA